MKRLRAKYPGTCMVCGQAIKRGDSIIWHGRGKVEHDDGSGMCSGCGTCGNNGSGSCPDCSVPRIIYTRFSSGTVVYRNARGRCEDAPCCGCCL